MKTIFAYLPIFFLLAAGVTAQDSISLNQQSASSAIGVKLGSLVSASYTRYFKTNHGIEFFAGYRPVDSKHYDKSFLHFNMIYYRYLKINLLEGLYGYAGIGVTSFIYDNNKIINSSPGIGSSGYVGVEYRSEKFPASISFDITARYIFMGYYNGYKAGFGSASLKYLFN